MKVFYRGIKEELALPEKTTGSEFIQKYFAESKHQILLMAVDGEISSLRESIPPQTHTLSFFDTHDSIGANCLAVSTAAILLRAAADLFPELGFSIEHSLGTGYYCVPSDMSQLPPDYLKSLAGKMNEIILGDTPVLREKMAIPQIKEFNQGRFQFVEDLPGDSLLISYVCDRPYWFSIPLVKSTGQVQRFRLHPYGDGFVLQFPNSDFPETIPPFRATDKLFQVIRESQKRARVLGIHVIHQLNAAAVNGRYIDSIQLYEALHEKKIAQIADQIAAENQNLRFVLIAGPSSSGKTSFMKRLRIQLKINGIETKTLSLDDYFINRDQVPVDENGRQDFEHFDMVDHNQLAIDLNRLMRGEAFCLPRFNFHTGMREYHPQPTELNRDELLLIEGIHALNPQLTGNIPRTRLFKIYISALTQLNFNRHNRVSTSDTRLLRRMLRDKQFRGYSVERTLEMWDSVRAGEGRWIFPYQEEADVMFNSALEYEWAIFRPFLENELSQIPIDSPVRPNGIRLLRLLELFHPISSEMVPPTSLLREFIGGSSFRY
jgi:uridine kinase